MTAVEAVSAATLLLLRDGAGGLEVLMIRRAEASSFAAGALVFPGGAVHEEDEAAALGARCRGLAALGPSLAAPAVAAGPRRQMSAAARKRIAAAQKKRWAEFHSKTAKPVVKKAAPKRKLSADARAKLAANLQKAREAKAAKKAARE